MSDDNSPVVWSPNVAPRQAEAINCRKKVLLLHGPRLAGKTRAAEHLICKHLYHNNRARVLIFAKTVKSAAIAGTYKELVEDVLPEWIGAGFGMEYTKEPSVDGSTRTHHFKVTNHYGTESECYLFSVEHDQEVEAKVKNIKGSMIYFIELSNFKSRIVFDATIAQLRSDTVPFDELRWVADTNPAEEGEDSWIHDIFFKKDIGDSNEPELQVMLNNEVHEILFKPEDNPYLDDRQWGFLRASYAHSQDLTDRYIKGLWVKDAAGGHFASVFSEETHVVGDMKKPEGQQEMLMPSENCMELLTGWDLGEVWHSFHVMEKVFTEFGAVYCVLDELYNNGDKVSIREFTQEVMERLTKYEDYIRDTYQREVTWRHWSDNAANNNYKAAAGAFDANVVYQASGGKIRLLSAPKGSGSVRRRVNITKLLLHEERLFISANCSGTIEMIKMTKKGKGELHFVARNQYKHRFDSMSYILDAEEPVEVQRRFAGKKKGSVISL